MRITRAIVEDVLRLLGEKKLSQRKIAKRIGISRATVGSIASGKRLPSEDRIPLGNDDFDRPLGPPTRCKGCGGMVYLPCRLCQVRALKAKERGRCRHRWQAA
jgi:transcriptional regulator with XRE-family HTH domain